LMALSYYYSYVPWYCTYMKDGILDPDPIETVHDFIAVPVLYSIRKHCTVDNRR
jgi:phenylacetate-coenzyme A ligase PaaK-like adenylate-forming protein